MTDLDPIWEEHAQRVATRVAELLEKKHVVTPAYLNAKQAARFLCVSEKSLEKWRREKTGPRYRRMNNRPRYKTADLTAWMDTMPEGGP